MEAGGLGTCLFPGSHVSISGMKLARPALSLSLRLSVCLTTVMMATPKVAASSKLKLSGIFLCTDAFAMAYSAKAPDSWLTRFLPKGSSASN